MRRAPWLVGLCLISMVACGGSKSNALDDAPLPPPDASILPPDASTPPPDAATPPPDAATPPPDSATPLPDAATPLPDAATPPPDAATPPPDAATPPPDAATPLPDAATPLPDAAPPLDATPPPDAPSDPDADGDGVPASRDCDDHDASVYPGAPELCDGKINNCGTVLNEAGTITFFPQTGGWSNLTALAATGKSLQPAPIDLGAASGTLNVCAGTFYIALTSSAPSLTVRGAGPAATILSSGLTARLLTMTAASTVLDVSGLKFYQGRAASGGAILGAGTLLVANTQFVNNLGWISGPTQPFEGGAVRWIGAATIHDAGFDKNNATRGGAIDIDGSLDLRNSTLTNNNATEGGAIAATGTVTLDTLTIMSNAGYAGHGGAILLTGATSTLLHLTMVLNQMTTGGYLRGSTAEVPSTMEAMGGAVMVVGGQATMEDSTLVANYATIAGGGLCIVGGADVTVRRTYLGRHQCYNTSAGAPTNASGFGGAIAVLDSTLHMEDSTFEANRGLAGFAVYLQHSQSATSPLAVDVTNTTFTGNLCAITPATPSSDREYRNGMPPLVTPLSGAVSFHCDNASCTP